MTGRNILPEEARKDIFLNIGEIYALTFDLLQELEERLKHWYVTHVEVNQLTTDVQWNHPVPNTLETTLSVVTMKEVFWFQE